MGMMRRSWVIEKHTDGDFIWYMGTPIEGGGTLQEIPKCFLRSKVPYFVVYEGDFVPVSLCGCSSEKARHKAITRLVHEYSWADTGWVGGP